MLKLDNKVKDLGIGVDIEAIDRFRKLDKIDDNLFLNKVFTKNEIDYCFSKKDPARHLAARYAGKEAIFKALSTIDKPNPDYKDAEIFNNKEGAPIARMNCVEGNNLRVYISLSHSEDKAIAFAIVMKGQLL